MIKRVFPYLIPCAMLVFVSCLEEIDLDAFAEENFVPNLVVESTLSDEMKIQMVYLSRTDVRTDLETDTIYSPFVPFGIGPRDSVKVEQNARVSVRINGANTIDFLEAEPGTYISEVPFAAENNSSYELLVETADGASYRSDPQTLTGTAEITNIYAERMTNEFGIEGVTIYIDGDRTEGDPQNYRYTFDETYKIIAPVWDDEEFRLTNYDPCTNPVTYTLEIVPREVQNRICYNTVPSRVIVQNSTAGNSSGTVSRFPVHFINRDDFIISHRYSIEVQQWVQSPEAYSYYQALDAFSQTGSIFSQVQPGTLRANVVREGAPNELVLGQFEVASISKRRLFFNFDDFFPGEELPPFPVNCDLHSSPESHASFCVGSLIPNSCPQSIIERVDLGLISYVDLNFFGIGTCPGPYVYVARPCGDCTVLGSNQVPEFWIE